MSEFPLDGLDIEPSAVQADLIAQVKEFVSISDVPEPDVIQPRPTNPAAIELFWIEEKLCLVVEPGVPLEAMFGRCL